MNTPYQCPRTRTKLELTGAALRGAKVEYPVREGVPVFLSGRPDSEALLNGVRLTELLTAARANGWRQALQSTFESDSGLLKYVTDDTRTAFLDLIPLHPEARVLEIGPGLGQITRKLAARVSAVEVLEINEEQAQFVKLSCEQAGYRNVAVACGGDDCKLPYPDERFDSVVLNLVFEWCGARFKGSHEAAQRTLLQEMHRVLKPGGHLYLTTKNRFGLRLLLGRQDEHFHGMPFGSCLPRSLGAAMLRRRGHERPGGYLYSFNQLQSLLREAGFAATRSYWAAPEIRYPEKYIDIDAAAIRRERRVAPFRQGLGRLEDALMRLVPAPLVKHLTHGFAVLATKR